MVADGKPADYHAYTADVESVGEVIRLWTTRNGRWLSPKLLAGESYGTLRAAALAEHLQTRYGLYLNGIALISMVLDLATIRFTEGNEAPLPAVPARRTRRSPTTTAATATGPSPTSSPRRRSTRPATTRGRWPAGTG